MARDFADQVIRPVAEGLDRDETIRPGTTLEGLASLNPVREGGRIVVDWDADF